MSVYKAYCLSNILWDKTKHFLSHSEYNTQPTRMNGKTRGILGSLYDLTYEPTKIIDNLYLGNSYNARDYYNLKDIDVGLIVNASKCIPTYFNNELEYIVVPVEDVQGANILTYLDGVIDKMHNFITHNKSKNILVHCFMGSSRSATIIIAYLMKYKGYGYRDALNFIKEKRPVVNLNTDFFDQLNQYEKSLKSAS